MILRALSLLARVENEDGIVRELHRIQDEIDRHPELHKGSFTADIAAALIVAQRQEIERVKAHAEAMASRIEWYAEEGWVNGDIPEAKAYRAAHQKDAP